MERGRLCRQDEDLGPVEVARRWRDRSRGLLGRDGLDGALWIEPASSLHSFGMRFDLDVAFLDRDGSVLRAVRLPRNRMTRIVLRAKAVVEAEAGTFARWNLRPGDQLRVATQADSP